MPPPFRADHIGSLLRPAALLDRRRQYEDGTIGHDQLEAAENQAIAEAVDLQARVGLGMATDGEFRRRSYHSYFYRRLGDITPDAVGGQAAGPGGRGAQPTAVVNSKVAWTQPIHVDDFKLLRSLTGAVPKITIPGPCAVHFRGGDNAVTAHAYRDVDEFWDDTVAAFRAELQALAAAGCTYVQIDETAFAKFGDPDVRAALAARGDDWSALIDTYIGITNRVVRDLPASLHIGMHLCRGNRGGHWHAEGGYDAVAERLFNRLAIASYFLEYDSPRAGDFAPLRHVPADKRIVLGLVSTKTAVIEHKDDLKRRLDAASRHVDLDRLSVSPQCGFASVAEGNPIPPRAQEDKLRLIVELAHEVWGTN
ncbi:MAG TPA: 5-methyltetrahydropteroyltriglutamate--homocysteine S-methyltransferase [Xanthobacteraceae bacterium]